MSTSLMKKGLWCTILLSTIMGMMQGTVVADDGATPITLTQGKVLREVWNNVPGSKLADADFNARYDTVEYLDTFDAPQYYADTFASRLTAYVTIPTAGTYTFYVASDDQSELQISVTGSLSDLTPVAGVDLYTKYLAWTRFPSQTSAPIALTAGQRILVRMLHKDGSQRDHASVGWSVDGSDVEIIPGSVCQAPSTMEPLLPPTSLVALAASDQQVTLNWAAPEMFHIKGYKVYRDGVDISGELPTLGYVDTTITPETAYTYTVTALNYQGEESVVSNAVDVTTMAVPPVGTGTGLTGFYYDTEYLTDRKLIRTDATVDFDWSGSPAPGVDANSFSVKWMGHVQPRYSGLWTLHTLSTDGVRLVVDGKMIIDDWKKHGPKWNSGTVHLEAGKKYPISLEYFDHYGSASIQLHWSSLCQPEQIIPQEQLYLEPYVTGSGIKIITDAESLTSPAFVEAKVGLDATSLTVTGTSEPLTRYKPLYAYTNMPLNADGTPTDITLATETDQDTQSLAWKPTVLNGYDFSEDEITIRQGDSLLLTALDLKAPGRGKANGLVKIDADGDGETDLHCAPGQAQPFRYPNPGSYLVSASVRGQEVGSLTVRVIGVDFGGSTVCQIGFNRSKEITIGGGAIDDIRILSFDPSHLQLSDVEPTESGAKFMLRPMPNGTPSYFVRLNDGPVIASQTVQTFELRSLNAKFIPVIERFDDGSQLLEAKLAMTPWIPNLEGEVNMITGGVTFDDSTQFKIFSTNNFIVDAATGKHVLVVRFIRPSGHLGGPCSMAAIFQGGIAAGRTGDINPKVVSRKWESTGEYRAHTPIVPGDHTLENSTISVDGDPRIKTTGGEDKDEEEERELESIDGTIWTPTGKTRWITVDDSVTGTISSSNTEVVAPDYSTVGEKTLYIIWDDSPYADDPIVATGPFTVTVEKSRWIPTGRYRLASSITAGTYSIKNSTIESGGDPGITTSGGADIDEYELKKQTSHDSGETWEDTEYTEWHDIHDTVTGLISTSPKRVVEPKFDTLGSHEIYIIWDDAPLDSESADDPTVTGPIEITVIQGLKIESKWGWAGDSEYAETGTKIVAGGYSSKSHSANVRLRFFPPLKNGKVVITMANNRGLGKRYSSSTPGIDFSKSAVPAKMVFEGKSTVEIFPDPNNPLNRRVTISNVSDSLDLTLWSSNKVEDAYFYARIISGGGDVSKDHRVDFVAPHYNIFYENSRIHYEQVEQVRVKCSYRGYYVAGHDLALGVRRIDYRDGSFKEVHEDSLSTLVDYVELAHGSSENRYVRWDTDGDEFETTVFVKYDPKPSAALIKDIHLTVADFSVWLDESNQ